MEDLNPSVQSGSSRGLFLRAEIKPVDSILESPSARWFAKESTNAADGIGGGERLATTTADAMEMPGATARAAESSEAGAGATGAVPEPKAQRPAALEEQAACGH